MSKTVIDMTDPLAKAMTPNTQLVSVKFGEKLYANLTEEEFNLSNTDEFIKNLPTRAAKGLAVLIYRAMKDQGDEALIPQLQYVDGNFSVPDYSVELTVANNPYFQSTALMLLL